MMVTDNIRTVLRQLHLTPVRPIEQDLMDKTKRSYSAFVMDKNDVKRFIKIRISDDVFQRQAFFHSYSVGRALDEKTLPLRQFTNRLIDGSVGQKIDYLLFEFREGVPLGSRLFHDVFKFMKQDIDSLKKIYESIKTFPTDLLPATFRHRGGEFFNELIMKDVTFDEKKLSTVYSDNELAKIIQLTKQNDFKALLDNSASTFQHGDFQAPNFVKTDNGLLILDFDQSGITNWLYDAAFFANHAFRKPGLCNELISLLFDEKKITEDEQIIWRFNQFVTAFVWVKIFLEKEDYYKKINARDFNIRKNAFWWRVRLTQKLLTTF